MLIILTYGANCAAQSLKELQDQYLVGKQMLKTEKYQPALTIFDSLLKIEKKNPFIEYAYFFSAFSAFKLHKYDTSSQKLTQLIKKYPRWEKIGEARFLLINVFLETKQYEKAFKLINKYFSRPEYFNRDKDTSITDDIYSMKRFYLEQIDSLPLLKFLQAKYMEDHTLAFILANRLSGSNDQGEDKMLLEYLIQEYNFKRDDFNLQNPGEGIHKEFYNVAILFPFMLSKLGYDNPQPNNQFVFDLYEGIRFAVNSLARIGININIFAYDTEKDTNKLKQILNHDELKVMDIIIGPLYNLTSQMAMNFAQQYRINIINPLSHDGKLIENNQYAFLFKSSTITQGRVAANFASNNFSSDTAIIIYGSTDKDSIMAYIYKETLEQDSVVVQVFEKVNNKSAMKIREIISNHRNDGHIFVASSDQTIAAPVMSALEMTNAQISLFTMSNWLDLEILSYDQLKIRKTHFIYPDYVDYDDDKVKAFISEFIKKTNTYPLKYAFIGYDLMLNFGKILYNYGNYFQDSLYTIGYTKGEFLQGFDYSWANDNQYVPIFKLDEEFQLELVNPVDRK